MIESEDTLTLSDVKVEEMKSSGALFIIVNHDSVAIGLVLFIHNTHDKCSAGTLCAFHGCAVQANYMYFKFVYECEVVMMIFKAKLQRNINMS
jgi:hypothetical protein